jgi:hypothetical protein
MQTCVRSKVHKHGEEEEQKEPNGVSGTRTPAPPKGKDPLYNQQNVQMVF